MRGACMRGVLLAGAAALPMVAAQAKAQEAPSASVSEVVVTASKTPTLITEVPQTVSVVTREELDLRGVQDLNQALSYSSGIRFRDYPGQQGMQEFFMRGFRVNNAAGSVFRDGLRQQFNGLDGDIETYGIERVELLKGPASVLYGQAAPGGLVNVFTKRPPSTPIGEALVQVGSFERRQAAGDIGGPLDDDGKYAYRLTGLYRDSGTQFDYVDDDRRYFAPAFTWRPSEHTNLTVLAQYFVMKSSGSDQSFPTSGTIYPNPNGKISSSRFLGEPAANRYRVENHNIGYDFSQDLIGPLRFEQTLRYTESDLSYIGVNVGGSAALVDDKFLNRLAIDRDAKSQSWLTDAHLVLETDIGEVETIFLAGIDYAWWRRVNVQRNGTVGRINVFDPSYGQPITWGANLASFFRQDLDQTGVYVQAQAKWSGLSVTGGLRKDWVDANTIVYTSNIARPTKDDKVTGRIGAIYEFDNGLAPYASYSTSFQPLAGATFAGAPFEPTTGKQYEVGVKYAPRPGLLLTLAVYNLTQQNIATPDIAHPGFFVQQGEVESKGAEFEAEAKVFGTNINFAYTYTDAEVSKANPSAQGVSTVGLKQLAVPLTTISLFANREFELGPGVLNIGGGVRKIAGSYDPTNVVKTDGYTLVDALAEYRVDKWSLSVNVNNLFDKTYFTPGFYTQSVFFGFERNVRATLRYRM